MPKNRQRKIIVSFPGDIDYLPPVRKFVAEILLAGNYDPKFAYRSEIVVDEVCQNAIVHGCRTLDALVELTLQLHEDRVELFVKDEGGEEKNRRRLKVATEGGALAESATGAGAGKLGLEIVRMLSEELDFEVGENNVTSVRVVRRKQGDRPSRNARREA